MNKDEKQLKHKSFGIKIIRNILSNNSNLFFWKDIIDNVSHCKNISLVLDLENQNKTKLYKILKSKFSNTNLNNNIDLKYHWINKNDNNVDDDLKLGEFIDKNGEEVEFHKIQPSLMFYDNYVDEKISNLENHRFDVNELIRSYLSIALRKNFRTRSMLDIDASLIEERIINEAGLIITPLIHFFISAFDIIEKLIDVGKTFQVQQNLYVVIDDPMLKIKEEYKFYAALYIVEQILFFQKLQKRSRFLNIQTIVLAHETTTFNYVNKVLQKHPDSLETFVKKVYSKTYLIDIEK